MSLRAGGGVRTIGLAAGRRHPERLRQRIPPATTNPIWECSVFLNGKTPIKQQMAREPSLLMTITEGYWYLNYWEHYDDAPRHDGARNLLYLDGHAGALRGQLPRNLSSDDKKLWYHK